MSLQKRASPSTSSGQASLLKRPRTAPTNQVRQRSERNHVPRSWLTEEDVRKVVREELERAQSHSTEYCQSCTGHALEDRVRSLENAVQKPGEAVEPANSHSPHLRRDDAKSMARSDARHLQLQLQTKLSLPIFTGKKLEGKGGDRISVALIDANTGGGVTLGPESSIKLDVVVLEGDFNKDDEDNWSQKEFENYMVKEREGKRPLLAGNLLVTLKGGVGELGDLIFTDNSSWNRSKMFRIGLKVASGYHGNTRIREAKTDAFAVKEHRGESYKKNYPPKSDDEVWRLEKIAKDGKSHKKLSEAGVHKVEDFLMQLFTDSAKLREILGKSITLKNWDCLIRHARTCKISWKLYLYYVDSMRKHGALFNTDCQLIGLIKDRVYVATHRLSAQEKEHGDTIVKKALVNLDDVREFNGETFSGSMQKESSSSFPSQDFEGPVENITPVQRNLAPQICDAPVAPEATPAKIWPVEDSPSLVVRDSQRPRNILGSGMPNKMWDALVELAKTCGLIGKLYVYHPDDARNVGVVFNNIHQFSGLIADGQYISADSLSDDQKVHVDTLVKKAYDHWMHVIEFEFPMGQQEYSNIYDHQAPADSGYNDGISTRYQNVDVNTLQFDCSSVPLQNPLISSSHQTQILSRGHSPASGSGFHAAGPSSLPLYRGAEELSSEEEIRMRSHEMLENEDVQHLLCSFNMEGHNQFSFNVDEYGYPCSSAYMANLSPNFAFNEDRSRSSGKAFIGWLKLKAALRWGIFVRKKAAERRAQLVELDEM